MTDFRQIKLVIGRYVSFEWLFTKNSNGSITTKVMWWASLAQNHVHRCKCYWKQNHVQVFFNAVLVRRVGKFKDWDFSIWTSLNLLKKDSFLEVRILYHRLIYWAVLIQEIRWLNACIHLVQRYSHFIWKIFSKLQSPD